MNAWIFDVDGVLSNLETRQVSEPTLLPALVHMLKKGDSIAFNTGRTTVWVEERVITPLKELLSDSSLLEHVFLASEKGGVWQQEGHNPVVQEKFIAPLSFRNKIRQIVEDEFSDTMFFDEYKQTMVSVEKRKEVSLESYQQRHTQLDTIIRKILQEEELTDTFLLADDLIAVDIQHKDAGKDIGMQHILTWLDTLGKKPDHFYCFGDNPSDAHMGELLLKHNLPFTFVYVGTKSLPLLPFPSLIPEGKFDKGTAEALKRLL